MPKKKTGQRKKADKQKLRQKNIREKTLDQIDTTKLNCNVDMVCDACLRRQKARAFCYFCQTFQRLPVCGHCGRSKCMLNSGECVVKHPNNFATGMGMMGAICDFCECFICHHRKCLTTHACTCPARDVLCVECNRIVWEFGGRFFRCNTCSNYLCEDDAAEHQGTCQILEAESYKCISCNRLGTLSCLRCKICFCDDHVKRKGVKYNRGEPIQCRKCGFPTQPTKDLSMSVRAIEYGRQQDDHEGGASYSSYYGGGEGGGDENDTFSAPFSGLNINKRDYEQYDEEDDQEGDEEEEEDEEESEEDEGEEDEGDEELVEDADEENKNENDDK